VVTYPPPSANGAPAEMADELDEVLQLAFQQMQTMSKELRVSQSGERALLNIITTETSRRRSAERRVEVLESLLASEIEAREASDSARQMAVDRANAYEVQYRRAARAWEVAQTTIEDKERALVSAEQALANVNGSFSSRLGNVRKAKEHDEQQSLVISMAMEGLLAREGVPRQQGEGDHAAATVATSGAVSQKAFQLKTQLWHFQRREALARVKQEFRRTSDHPFYLADAIEIAAIDQAALWNYHRGSMVAEGESMP